MFQTDFHIWLQEFDSEWIIKLFQGITALGYTEFFMFSLIVTIFGLNFRKGFILLILVMWTAAVTLVLKDTFDLPRPYMVENEVVLLDGAVDTDIALLDDAQANSFFELLPKTTREYFDNKPIPYGFPSGHTSIAIAFWGALALLFRRRWLSIISISLILLIPFSRIYLGVHFIADVIGGYLVGGVMLLSFYQLVIRPKALEQYLQIKTHQFAFDFKNFLITIAPLLWLFALEDTRYWIVPAVLWGFGLGFMGLSQKGLPNETGTTFHRIFRVITALIIFGGTDFVLKKIIGWIGFADVAIFEFIINTLTTIILMWFGTLMHYRLKWASRV